MKPAPTFRSRDKLFTIDQIYKPLQKKYEILS